MADNTPVKSTAGDRATRLPDFLIIGAAKAGTTGVAGELLYHPGVFMPGRETSFFTWRWDQGLDWYRGLFEKAPAHALIGEKTPNYVCRRRAMERIRGLLPSVRLILLVRDPVARVLSQVNHRLQEQRLPETTVVDAAYILKHLMSDPKTFTEFITRGFYREQIETNVLPLFREGQLLVRSTDRIQESIDRDQLDDNEQNPGQLQGSVMSDAYKDLLADVCRFLGIDPPENREHRLLGVRRYQFSVTDDALELLRRIYRGRNAGLGRLAGESLTWE